MAKTSTGLEENIAGLLCYVLGWISGIVFVLLERENSFVKYHAIQLILVFGAISVVMGVFSWVPILGLIVYILLGILAFVLWIFLMVKASQGERYKIKWAGEYAERWAGE